MHKIGADLSIISSRLPPQRNPAGFCHFFFFYCNLVMFERKDCLYLEGKWVRDGPKIIFGGKMGIEILFLVFRKIGCGGQRLELLCWASSPIY